MKKSIFLSIFIVTFFAFFLGFYTNVFASNYADVITQQQTDSVYDKVSSQMLYQTFTPVNNNNAVEFLSLRLCKYGGNLGSGDNLYINICPYIATSSNYGGTCTGSSRRFYYSFYNGVSGTYNDISDCSVATTTVHLLNSLSSDQWQLASGTTYIISINGVHSGHTPKFSYQNSNVFSGGTFGYYDGTLHNLSADLVFAVIPTGLIQTENTNSIDANLSLTQADFSSVQSQTCFINTTCKLWFYWNSLAVGQTLYLHNYDTSVPNTADNSIDSYLFDNAYHGFFELPIASTSTSTKYNLSIISNEMQKTIVGIDINWIDGSSFNLSEYDIASACDDVASSTGTFDDLRYGMECGLRKFSYWALVAHPETYLKYQEAQDKFQNVFPYSVFNGVNQTYSALLIATATDISLPVFWGLQKQNSFWLSSSTISSSLISNSYNIFYQIVEYLIYGMVFMYFLKRIMQISRDNNNIE